MALWKVSCMEGTFPGMWQRWFLNQCVGIGWPPMHGYSLNGASKHSGWNYARKAMKEAQVGDRIVVTLHGNRVGRIGTITAKAIEDDEWEPLVPKSRDLPNGEMGRRLLVRWDLTIGPDSRDMVVELPAKCRISSGELRRTIARVHSQSTNTIIGAMCDPANWVGLATHFDYERALSGFIAAYPHRLEDGLLPHPNDSVRERVFSDRSRLDVLLEDRNGTPVIVECKQHGPTQQNIDQIRRYMRHLQRETGLKPRGILVHGGARKLPREIGAYARQKPEVEIVQYSLDVDFSPCS